MAARDGLINFFKPVGITSAKALYKVRAVTGLRKSGHTGTLDPAAEGVLVIGVGRGTKLTERMMDQPKVYRAAARLDVTSASYDRDRETVPVPVARVPEASAVGAALQAFEGTHPQVPPSISALKVGGVPAYRLARAGKAPALRARPVTIYWIVMHDYAWPDVTFEMACGRGTYVRAVVRDLGDRLGTGGCLMSLRRTAVGPFDDRSAWTLDRLAAADADAYALPLEQARQRLAAPPVIPPRPDIAGAEGAR